MKAPRPTDLKHRGFSSRLIGMLLLLAGMSVVILALDVIQQRTYHVDWNDDQLVQD